MQTGSTAATVASYNQISDELAKRVPKLHGNRTIKYRVAGSYNPKSKKYSLLTALHIPATDVIYDPGIDDWVNIALIERILPNGQPKFIDLWITDQTNNVVVINAKKNLDQQIYRYFELCNYNVSNPNRDTNAPKLIERIDDVANYMAEHELSERRRAAMAVVMEWSDEAVIEYWQAIDPTTRVTLKASDGKGLDKRYFAYLKARLMEKAETNPEAFVEQQAGNFLPAEDVANVIARARNMRLFILNSKVGEFTWPDGKILFKYKRGFGVKPYTLLKDFFVRDPQGRADFEIVRSEVETK
ncbi:MAG: hypothetical protein DRI46_06630 [Chloroflexi bacterium]|nr:MAG: hypothetical protein DRI46_06630 [Chloroflexota bacterium]